MANPRRLRLDELLVQRGYASSREQARALVLAGQVAVSGRAHPKAGVLVPNDVTLAVTPLPTYVSRGGSKLAYALDHFRIDPRERVCADIGASTGGFTDCLLQRGAGRVYAIDVGHGQLHWRLRSDPRVVVMDRINARYLTDLPEAVDLVVIDVSFISLQLVLPIVPRIAKPEADALALVKPQFEAGRERIGKGGVVRDPAVHREVLRNLIAWLQDRGFSLGGVAASPLRGPAGNVEFFTHIRFEGSTGADPEQAIDWALGGG